MLLDQALFDSLLADAAASPRRRSFLNLHQSHAEPVQRMIVAMHPDSYVPPHQHLLASQWELFVVLQGQIDFLLFSSAGQLLQKYRLTAGQSHTGLELAPGQLHSLMAVDGPAVFLEVKQGPFDPAQPRAMAAFAPTEQNTNAAGQFLQQMRLAQPGDYFQTEDQT